MLTFSLSTGSSREHAYTDNGVCTCAQNIYCQSFGKEEGEKNRVIMDLGTKEGRRQRLD